MTRTLFAALLVSAPAVALASGKQLPPDSIEPAQRLVKVTVAHKQERTVSCTAQTKAKQAKATSCLPKLEAMRDASTQVQLVPVPPPNLVAKDQRRPVTLEHPRDGKEVSAELAPGVWQLVWAGRSQQERFRVTEDAPVKIQLKTTRGQCVLQESSCKLNPASTRYEANIPKQHHVN